MLIEMYTGPSFQKSNLLISMIKHGKKKPPVIFGADANNMIIENSWPDLVL